MSVQKKKGKTQKVHADEVRERRRRKHRSMASKKITRDEGRHKEGEKDERSITQGRKKMYG